MTALYTNNFETETAGAALPGWVTVAGSGMQVTTVSTVGQTAVQGTKSYGRNSDGDSARWDTGGVLTNQAIRTAARIPTLVAANFQAIGHTLRINSAGTQAYFILLDANGTGIRARIFKYASGNTLLSASGYSISPSSTDTLHFESKIVGSSIEVRLWLNNAARPASPTVSATDSSFASGYAGLRHSGAFGWAFADQLVITDAAGGEDYFYPAANDIASASSSVSTAMADITTQIVLAASPSAISSATAVLAEGGFGSTAVSIATATANITTSIQLLASGSTITTVTSDLTTSTVYGFFTPALKNNSGTILANETNVAVNVYNPTTGALVVRKTGLTSDAAGVVLIKDAALVNGTTYSYEIVLSSNGRRLPIAVAA